MQNAPQIVQDMRNQCARLTLAVDDLTTQWLTPALARLALQDAGSDPSLRSKHLNDAIWRTVEFEKHEVLLLDSPMLQRLRGVKQLGLANLVFPGANHDRFEHICGVVEGADRMFSALFTNADRRRQTTAGKTLDLPPRDQNDRVLVRLAALLHDVGHGPFSHAIEPVISDEYKDEVKNFNNYALSNFFLDSKVSVAELISILVVLSPKMGELLNNPLFKRPENCSVPEFQLRISTLIMGARQHDQLACLSAIISGQVDADKLDYMARDALHSGMPIAFDTERLLRKLEIVRCTAESLPNNSSQNKNRQFAAESDEKRYFDLGISSAGVGALEQMLIGRAFLYDRLYHHHKVRAADAMAQRLLHFVREEREKPFELNELYLSVSDDTMLRLLGGEVTHKDFVGGKGKSAHLARAILERDLYVRAFAFRAVFHTGIPVELDEEKRTAELAEIWSPVSAGLADLADRLAAEGKILEIAKRIGPIVGDARICKLSENLNESQIIVDLADNRVKPVTINIHAEDGTLEEPNLFFDPSRWSHVYDLQKRTGYVFCPREMVPIVALAAKIFFFEKWGYAVSDKADRFTKTLDVIKPKWVDALFEATAIDETAKSVLKRERIIRSFIRESDLQIPANWVNAFPDLKANLSDELRNLLPQGISSQDKSAVIKTIDGISSFILTMHLDKKWITTPELKEADLQRELARHLRARNLEIDEGGNLGGGQYDLIVERRTLIENKISGPTSDPFEAKPDAPYQANRYGIAKCMRVFFTMVGYVPRDEASIVPQESSLRIRKVEQLGYTAVEICAVMPFGAPTPSHAIKPTSAE